MQHINITKEGKHFFVEAPWNPLFIGELKKLHGKWNPDKKIWTVDSFVDAQLHEIICEIFGDLSGPTIESIKCSVISELRQEQDSVGSKKHWYSIIPQGSEFIIHDVPVDLYQNYVDGTGIYASLRKNIVIVEKR